MSVIGKILYYSGSVRIYANGGGAGFLWRWWYPLSWVLCPIAYLMSFLIIGIPETIRYPHDMGIVMAPFFIEHPDKLRWL